MGGDELNVHRCQLWHSVSLTGREAKGGLGTDGVADQAGMSKSDEPLGPLTVVRGEDRVPGIPLPGQRL